MFSKGSRRPAKVNFVYDRWILLTAMSLIAVGLLMVASASMVISDRQFGDPLHYIIRQVIYLALGVGLAWVVSRIPTDVWRRVSLYLLLGSLFLLVVVLVPHIGKVVNGSRRWISVGLLSLQVSEVAKFCGLVYLASYIARFHEILKTDVVAFIKPMVILGVMALLLLLEPDFGAATVLTMVFLGLLFIAGVRLWPFSILFLMVVAALASLAIFTPYRLERLTTFMNPWAHQFGPGYQLTQSLIAFGRGGLFGVGLGNSVQKLFYLPEAHTDFLFAVLGEELGLMGELLVVGLFVVLISRIFQIARHAHENDHLFNAFFAYGAGLWIGLQALINIGVNTGLLPTKGLTLPLISYGGSSMLINCVVIGILLRIFFEECLDDVRPSSSRLTRY